MGSHACSPNTLSRLGNQPHGDPKQHRAASWPAMHPPDPMCPPPSYRMRGGAHCMGGYRAMPAASPPPPACACSSALLRSGDMAALFAPAP
mmetsp:Transcript_19825/g.43144  ORF Transcript_19825/g.43144 Transcript_19825/m.43144 type:complete len:91 (-) Transcript_19825:2100-2372(-)